MDTETKISKFKEFYTKYLYIIEENIIIEKIVKTFIETDFMDLARFSLELSEDLLDDPENTIKTAEIAIKSLNLKKEIDKVQVMFYNLPTSSKLQLSEISNQLNTFLYFEGYVVKPSDIFLKCESAVFECPSCGNLITIQMILKDDNKRWVEPRMCGCGFKGKFKLFKKNLIRYQKIELQEAFDSVPEKPKKPVTKKVFLSEFLTRKKINSMIQPGRKFRVFGWLELEGIPDKKGISKTNEFKINLMANNVIPMAQSWDSIKLTKQEIEMFKSIPNKYSLLTDFAISMAPTFEGYLTLRESLILQHVGSKRVYDENGTLEERGTIHILLVSSPGKGKTHLAKKSLIIAPNWQWAQGSGLTDAGLVACVVKDEYSGGFSLDIGPLPLSEGSICFIDEGDKMKAKDYGALNTPMNDEQTKITKGNVDQTISVKTSILMASNPKQREFVDSEPIEKQLAPIPRDIIDRFDLIWVMRDKINYQKVEEKYLLRHIKSEKKQQKYSNLFMQHYISHTRNLNPILTEETIDYFKKKFGEFTGNTSESNIETSQRLRGNLFRLIYAYSKFTGVGKELDDSFDILVEKKAIDYAFHMIKSSFELRGLITDNSPFATYESVEDIPSKQEVNTYYLVRDLLKQIKTKYNNLMPFEVIIQELKNLGKLEKVDDDEVYELLGKMKEKGDLFEPRRNQFGLL